MWVLLLGGACGASAPFLDDAIDVQKSQPGGRAFSRPRIYLRDVGIEGVDPCPHLGFIARLPDDSSRSGRGFPAPGRFSKAPSSWACRICSSNQDSQLTPGGLRSVMSPPTRRGSPLPMSACSMTARTPRFPSHLPNSWTGATNRATKMSSPRYCDPYGARLKSA